MFKMIKFGPLLVSPATFQDRGLKTRHGQSQSDPFTNWRECPERRVRKATSDPRGTFCIKMLIFLAQSFEPLVTTI